MHSNRCCPTNEMWELPTPLIVANRSQQRDEVYGSYPLIFQYKHPLADNNTTEASNINTEAYKTAHIITHARFNAVKQDHLSTSVLSYKYHKRSPEQPNLKPAKPNKMLTQGRKSQNPPLGATSSTSSVLPYELNNQL
ncbi:F-box/LRR-repeat protein [Dorcoceras hygrometricum]|uniref:F-box/LRR-repeat protein n=1 Tax=Dorcoceras hygrometricum TaxID=472368 RepID=A0A2Z7B9E9_9LAMI|nr:F-box/LRR-repeat protein [Dorcoceras hygrometricum]